MNDTVRLVLVRRLQSAGFYFIDFEASSLSERSWPIEIGLAHIENGKVVADGRLIRPQAEWDLDDWSAASETIHQIALARLTAEGAAAVEVAQWFAKMNLGIGITDAPRFDRHWLGRLLSTHLPMPQVTLLDFDQFIATMLPTAQHYNRVYDYLENTPTPHRAREDASRLAEAFLEGLKSADRGAAL